MQRAGCTICLTVGVHQIDHLSALLLNPLGEVLVGVHGDSQILVPQALLNVFQRGAVFHQHGCVGVAQAVIIKLRNAQLFLDDGRGVLHRAGIDIAAILTNTDEMHGILSRFLCDGLLKIQVVAGIALRKIAFSSFLPRFLPLQEVC